MKSKLILALFSLFSLTLLKPAVALAHCPLCAAGAGAGLTLSRVLGVDDAVTGVWLGAFLGAISFWTQRSLGVRKPVFLGRIPGVLIYVLVFVSTVWSFYQFNLVGQYRPIWGFDRLVFGIVAGGLFFYLIDVANTAVKRARRKSFFPYQSVVFSLVGILIVSLIVYVISGYY